MTQWGSKYLGDQGYSSIDILRYYYGDDMYINTAEQIQGIPSSWPGANLDIGSSGQKVKTASGAAESHRRLLQGYTTIVS